MSSATKKARRPSKKSEGEETFALQLRAQNIQGFDRQHRFHDKRRWAFDFAFHEHKIAIEIEGGTWGKFSRHTTGAGFAGDKIKYAEAALYGWRVLAFTTDQVKSGLALKYLRAAMTGGRVE